MLQSPYIQMLKCPHLQLSFYKIKTLSQRFKNISIVYIRVKFEIQYTSSISIRHKVIIIKIHFYIINLIIVVCFYIYSFIYIYIYIYIFIYKVNTLLSLLYQ